MLDGKVLTAVLASLAAIGAAINGGDVNAERLQSNKISAPGEFSFNDLVPESISSLDKFLQNPEPENPVKAVFVSEDINDEKLKVKDARLRASNFTSISFGGKTATSDEQIALYGFTGELLPGEVTEVNGRSRGFTTSGVNISGSLQVRRELDADRISVTDVRRAALKLKEVSGTVSTNTSSAEVKEPRKVSINSFSGSITVFPGNSTIVLDGKVDRLESGSFSFGN
ncbi:MAG: hypothetical protein ABEJ91_02235 [Candidatus Nanohaloarchaea archaeon]